MNKKALPYSEKELLAKGSLGDQIAYLKQKALLYEDDRLARLALAERLDELLEENETLSGDIPNPIMDGLEKEYDFPRQIQAIESALATSDLPLAGQLLAKALPLAEELVSYTHEQNQYRYCYYEDAFEQLVDYCTHPQDKTPRGLAFPLATIFALEGEFELKEGQSALALKSYEKAIRYAPAHLEYRKKHYEIDQALDLDKDSLRSELISLFPYARNAEDVASFYLGLANFAEEKNDAFASQLYYALALSFSEEDEAREACYASIQRIAEASHHPYEIQTGEDLQGFLKKEGVPMGSDGRFLEALETLVVLTGKDHKEYDVAIPLAESLVSLSCHEESAVALYESLLKERKKAQS